MGTAFQPPAAPPAPGRLGAVDTTRGVALLGIMLVNVHFFTSPLASYAGTSPDPSGGWVPAWLDEVCYDFSRAICEGKFYPLYSLLFGAGMVFILQKTAREGQRFWAVYLRRLLALGVIGFVHGTLVWYGDILFFYAWIGLGLLLLGPRCSGRTLCIIGACFLGVGAVLTVGMGMMGMLFSHMRPAYPEMPADLAALPPGERLLQGFARNVTSDVSSPAWKQIEHDAYTQGPFLQTTIVRSVTYAFSFVFSVFIMGPFVAGMFLLGAGMMKLGFWDGRWTAWHTRLLALGVLVGLPLSVGGVVAMRLLSGRGGSGVLAVGAGFGAPLVTLGIATAVVAWVRSGKCARLARLLSVPGRMGLSCYLLTSVLMTFVAYHWGLALWGTFGSAEQVGLCLLVYTVLIAVSHLWLARFSVGPVEWAWKCVSYLRIVPTCKAASDGGTT